MSKFVILGGPSCVGKGPLCNALSIFYPEINNNFEKIVLYNSRDPRPGEINGIDYHFRSREEIQELAKEPGFYSEDVRGDLQAFEIDSVKKIIEKGKDAFFEGNPFIAVKLKEIADENNIQTLTVFLAPLSKEEIEYLNAPERNVKLEKFVTDVMRRKLLFRTKKQKTILSLKDLENIERRCGSAYKELKFAHQFENVIPNHNGEGNDNWDAFYYPIADARKSLIAFVSLLKGEQNPYVEKWEKDLIP